MSAVTPTLLVVDDEAYVLDTVSEIATQAGFAVVTAASGNDGIRASRERRTDLAMVDLKMPDVGGLEVLRAIHDSDPRCQMILMTGHASVETAVEAIKMGAMDYLSKPLDVRRVEQLLSNVRVEVERRHSLEVEQQTRQRECFGMIGTGVAMQLMAEVARRTATQGGTYLRWLVHTDNASARAFYRRFAHEWHNGFCHRSPDCDWSTGQLVRRRRQAH